MSSFAVGWLNDDASASAVTRRILDDNHPLKPEMWLQLCATLHSGTMVTFVVEGLWRDRMPDRVAQCENSAWRLRTMPLLEFIRKTNENGQIKQFIKNAFKKNAADNRIFLEEFANEFLCRGETLTAAIFCTA